MSAGELLELGLKLATICFAAGGAYAAGLWAAKVTHARLDSLETRLEERFADVHRRIDDAIHASTGIIRAINPNNHSER
jgi:hypothetical protein